MELVWGDICSTSRYVKAILTLIQASHATNAWTARHRRNRAGSRYFEGVSNRESLFGGHDREQGQRGQRRPLRQGKSSPPTHPTHVMCSCALTTPREWCCPLGNRSPVYSYLTPANQLPSSWLKDERDRLVPTQAPSHRRLRTEVIEPPATPERDHGESVILMVPSLCRVGLMRRAGERRLYVHLV